MELGRVDDTKLSDFRRRETTKLRNKRDGCGDQNNHTTKKAIPRKTWPNLDDNPPNNNLKTLFARLGSPKHELLARQPSQPSQPNTSLTITKSAGRLP
jgi:hypothetical protein